MSTPLKARNFLSDNLIGLLPGHIVIFGLGYTAEFLVELCLKYGIKVTASCRSKEKQAALQKRFQRYKDRITIVILDNGIITPDDATILTEAVTTAGAILSSIPPDKTVPDVSIDFLEKIAVKKNRLGKKWFGYLSATSVYGNHNGRWVDEKAHCKPTALRGKMRYQAESNWMRFMKNYREYHDNDSFCHILRLPGIYGPGRSVVEKLQAGKNKFIHKPDHLFCRIQVFDIVRAICYSMAAPQKKDTIYNVSDDCPANLQTVYSYAADLLGLPEPAPQFFDEANISAMQRSFYHDDRKISNKKLKHELNFSLLYPSYREGLQAIFEYQASKND